MHPSRANNPLFGPNRFKLGVFSANCDGGLTMSLAPERWRADWDDIVAMTPDRRRGRAGIHPAGGEVARLPGQGQHLRPLVRDPDAWRRPRRADQAHRDLLHRARAAGHAGVRRQGDRHHRSRHARPRRPQHRLRLEPGRVRPARRHHRPGPPLRARAGMVPRLVAPAGGRSGVRLGRRVLSSETTADRSRLGAAALAGGDVGRLLAQGPRLRRAGRRCAVHHDERARSGPCPARRHRRARRAIRQARRYLHHVARGVPADPSRGGGVLPLLRRGDGRCRGPGLLPAPARTGGEGRGRQRDPPPAGQPLHARLRQALRRRLSRRLPAGRHAGRHRCRHGADERSWDWPARRLRSSTT